MNSSTCDIPETLAYAGLSYLVLTLLGGFVIDRIVKSAESGRKSTAEYDKSAAGYDKSHNLNFSSDSGTDTSDDSDGSDDEDVNIKADDTIGRPNAESHAETHVETHAETHAETEYELEPPAPTFLMFKAYNATKPHWAPTRGSEFAAGFDLYAAEDLTLASGETWPVGTNISIAIPAGCYGRVAPRSGLSLKGLFVNAGVIDADYRGEVRVVLFNSSDEEFKVEPGDRIAQLILEKYEHAELMLCDELPETIRGEGGFGSSGK